MKLLLTVLAFFGLINGHYGLYPAIPKCSWTDPNLTTCLVDLFEAIRPMLKTGIPGLFSGLEPLLIAMIPIQTSVAGTKLRIEVTNILAWGGSDAEITNFVIDSRSKTADLTVVVPRIDVTAGYTFDSHHAVFPNLHSVGQFSGVFYDVTVKIRVRGELINNYPEYLIVQDAKVNISFGKKTTFHLETISGDTTAKIAAKLLNIFPKRLLLFFMKSSMNKAASNMLKKYLNLILGKMPLQDLLN